jgi:TetR/AcrR family transcriptional regulator
MTRPRSGIKQRKPANLEPRHLDAFDRIPEEKKQRVLDTAIAEFARMGFARANVNTIAAKAGISVGSIYKYFPSKDALFLSITEQAHLLLEEALQGIDQVEGSVYDKIEAMLSRAMQFAREKPDLNRVYLACMQEEMVEISAKLPMQLELITTRYYRALIAEGQKKGEIAPDLDPRLVSFCLDNLLLMMQFSPATTYLEERMKLFLGRRGLSDAAMVQETCLFVRRALSPRGI